MIGALEVSFTIMGARSLKDKRKVLKSLKDRYCRMNISVSEVGYQDKWQASTLAFAVVSNEAVFINSVLDRIINALVEHPEIEVIDHHSEIIHI